MLAGSVQQRERRVDRESETWCGERAGSPEREEVEKVWRQRCVSWREREAAWLFLGVDAKSQTPARRPGTRRVSRVGCVVAPGKRLSGWGGEGSSSEVGSYLMRNGAVRSRERESKGALKKAEPEKSEIELPAACKVRRGADFQKS